MILEGSSLESVGTLVCREYNIDGLLCCFSESQRQLALNRSTPLGVLQAKAGAAWVCWLRAWNQGVWASIFCGFYTPGLVLFFLSAVPGGCRENNKHPGTGSSLRFLWLLSNGLPALCVIRAG